MSNNIIYKLLLVTLFLFGISVKTYSSTFYFSSRVPNNYVGRGLDQYDNDTRTEPSYYFEEDGNRICFKFVKDKGYYRPYYYFDKKRQTHNLKIYNNNKIQISGLPLTAGTSIEVVINCVYSYSPSYTYTCVYNGDLAEIVFKPSSEGFELDNITINCPSLTLNETDIVMHPAESANLVATVLPELTSDMTVTWTSSDESVATVDATGRVTANAVGNAVITAACGNLSATCTVTVVPIEATSIALNKETILLRRGETETLIATVSPANTTYKNILWTSSNENVAMVENGVVEAVGNGNATITATCGTVSAICNVEVVDKFNQTITWEQDLDGLSVGSNVTLTATASSGLPVEYKIEVSGAEIVDGKLQIRDNCLVSIVASQSGNNEYEPATPITKPVTNFRIGDVNSDGQVNIFDVYLLLDLIHDGVR